MQWLMLLPDLYEKQPVPLKCIINPLLSPSTAWVLTNRPLQAFSPLATDFTSGLQTDLRQLFLRLKETLPDYP